VQHRYGDAGSQDVLNEQHHSDDHELYNVEENESDKHANEQRRHHQALEDRVENLLPLLSKLKGHLERGNTNPVEHHGGVPRGWSRPRSLESMADADTVETFLWASDPSPNLPRTQKRMKQGAAGRVAIIRDTSMSMQGMWNQWAALLCTSVMEMSQKQKMRVGYLEFNTRAQKFVENKQFFTHEYESVGQRMAVAKCEGLTNYEAPLSIALDEFEAAAGGRGDGGRGDGGRRRRRRTFSMKNNGSGGGGGGGGGGGSGGSHIDFSGKGSSGDPTTPSASNVSTALPWAPNPSVSTDQHILFITDGQPTSGDRFVSKELERARQLGVSVHTVFIGYRSCPQVLDRLSKETSGSRWASFFCPHDKSIQVVDRESSSFDQHGKDMELRMVDRMTRMPTVFQRYLDENNVIV